jgi:hypothetical protein
MPAVTEAAKERQRAKARERYRQRKSKLNIPTVGYRAKGCGPGRNGRCVKCKRLMRPEDFRTDVITGLVIEPDLCSRCAG